MRKILIALTTLALTGTGLIAVASPAAAHHNTVSGVGICDTQKGEWNITWSVVNSEGDKSETVTSSPEGVASGTIAAGATGTFSQTTTGTGPFSLTVYGVWSNGVKSTNSGTASLNARECRPPQPQPKVDVTEEERMSCETGVDERTATVTTPYVWDPQTRTWVFGTPSAPVYGAWTFVRDLTLAEQIELKCVTLATPVAPKVVASPRCEVNGSVTPAKTEGVVYVVGGTSPTAITVTATPAKGFYFASESQEVVFGPYDVSAKTCPGPTPDPTPTPEPTPTPTPEPTPTVTPTPEPTPTPIPTPTTVPQQPEGIETLPPTTKPFVPVPEAAAIPNAVPAGDGSSQDSGFPWILVVIAILAGLAGWSLAGLRK